MSPINHRPGAVDIGPVVDQRRHRRGHGAWIVGAGEDHVAADQGSPDVGPRLHGHLEVVQDRHGIPRYLAARALPWRVLVRLVLSGRGHMALRVLWHLLLGPIRCEAVGGLTRQRLRRPP